MSRTPNADLLRDELILSTSRSGGPGGQHVNKVETKVLLKFDVPHSKVLSPEEKETLLHRLDRHLTRDGILLVMSQESRSQTENREIVLEKLNALLAAAFQKRKKRKATRATAASKRRRIQSKKSHGEKKKWRQRPADS